MNYTALPLLNARLNLASALLLIVGYLFIRRKQVLAHRTCMVAAFLTSALFLISYVISHIHNGIIHYQGQGTLRGIYFLILTTHTILAVTIVPLILRTLYLAMNNRFEEHRHLARWTLPLWFYVSVTGVVIYKMLY